MPFNRKAFAIAAGCALLLSPLFSTLANARPNAVADSNSTTIARKMGEATPEKMEQRLQKMAKELNLTPAQVDQIRTLRSTTRTNIDGVLSADQKAIIKAALAEKKDYKAAMQAANVTDAQRAQRKQIWKDSETAMEKILTPEQRAKWTAKMQEHKGKRQGNTQCTNVPR